MLALAVASLLLPKYDVSFDSLVVDCWKLGTLCEYPDPFYETRQASSYDRASQTPGNEAWFANKDWGNFVRDETNNGRKEHVLADLKGPGVVVRYWSPNPAGVTRVYIDGSTTPTIEAKSTDLLSGKVAPFLEPMSAVTSSGWSLYCPIAYQKSLKVTVDDSDNDAGGRMYYQIQYRSYADGVTVEPFSADAVARVKLASLIGSVPALPMLARDSAVDFDLAPGGSRAIPLKGPRQVAKLLVTLAPQISSGAWDDPRAWQNILRSVQVVATFDGEPCVDVPLGDLMCSTAGVNPLMSMPAFVGENGLLVLNLPMPYRSTGSIEFQNRGKAHVSFKVAAITEPYTWTDRSMHFKAQWTCYNGGTRPMRDLPFLHATGQGVYVGCNVTISNPVSGWWGEGDEKIYLDGESFPSTFGTGTEDFFGYGWSNPALFQHPYHFQSRCDGPGTKGHSCIGRWQVIDRLPFASAFNFDMELWHWVDCQMMYGRTVYWYAKPSSSGPASDDGSRFMLPFIEGAPRVKGALEGEEMKLDKTGGEIEVQAFDGLSNGKQLWWRDSKVGDRLQLAVKAPAAGRYHVFGRFCFARDYGVHSIQLGSIDTTVDFFGELGWKTLDLGTTVLREGANALSVRTMTPNPKALPNNMFGLDYLLLVRE